MKGNFFRHRTWPGRRLVSSGSEKSKIARKIYGQAAQFKRRNARILGQYLDGLEIGVNQSDIVILSPSVKEVQNLIKRVAR